MKRRVFRMCAVINQRLRRFTVCPNFQQLGIGLFVAAEGFDEGVAIWDYRHGTISRQQFIGKSAGVGTGAGMVALGAVLGTCIPGVGPCTMTIWKN